MSARATDKCACCGVDAPEAVVAQGIEAILGRERDQVGWATFKVGDRLIVEVPAHDSSILSGELATMIGVSAALDATVVIEPDPECEAPRIRQEISGVLGIVCPDCLSEKGWDESRWLLYLSESDQEGGA